MNPAIVIPTYWSGSGADMQAPGTYDHSTPIDAGAPDLERCLSSLEQVQDLPHRGARRKPPDADARGG